MRGCLGSWLKLHRDRSENTPFHRSETSPLIRNDYNGCVKTSIVVVEDDPDISRLVRHHLEGAGFAVRLYSAGTTVISDAERQRHALFLLDIMVPGKDGLELCRQIRQLATLAAIPVIFLTAKSAEADRVLGLELGADDYIPKPFSPRELVARVKAVLRRFERPLSPGPVRAGDIEIDPNAMTLTVRGKVVPTTATEFRLLDHFARNAGRVFTRDQLLDSCGVTLPMSHLDRSTCMSVASAKRSNPIRKILATFVPFAAPAIVSRFRRGAGSS
jgi:two-component system phosphate regulon response regulator PhoB